MGTIMKYIRTKDGRIVEESKLEPGLKQNLITITRKSDNKEITQLNVDYASDYLNWFAICEYCRCHKINPKDIKYEITTLFNDVLKQADTIEELICDDDILYIHDLYPDAVLVVEGNIKPFGYPTAIKLKEWLSYKHIKFDLLIKDSKGNYIKRAYRNEKGEIELL